ncbi:hypothetical protein CVT24_006032 [Panaeolus cyanescens]|uniref:Uncharacterized protein n=1 Tax=Panaeolus cyanescens TaxID=181874 RepID=A0A409YE19_9AGAR|nr:hypothetical protein CVT24_006032 [Panaeolus cyanescens]
MLSQLQRPTPLPLTPHKPVPVKPTRGSMDGKSPLDIVRPNFPRAPGSAPAYATTFGHARTQSYPGGPVQSSSVNKKKAALLDIPTIRARRISAPSSPVKEKPWEKAEMLHLHSNGSSSSLHIPRQPSPLIFTPELYDGHVPVTLLESKPLPRTASQASLTGQKLSPPIDLRQTKSQMELTRVESSSKLSTTSSKESSSSKVIGGLKNYAKSLFHGNDVVRKKAKPSDNSAATPNTLLLNNYYNGNNLPPALQTPADTLPAPRPRPAKAGQAQTVGNRRSIFSLH